MLGWQCQKPQKLGVETGHTNTEQITPSLQLFFMHNIIILEHKEICHIQKKDVGMGLFVQCLYALSLDLVSVVFGTAIPTSLNVFGKCSFLLVDSSIMDKKDVVMGLLV